ncbi:hypothetical protein ACTMTJ_37680 [Phytohabitans sp. LJ34]|uniref:hypothetical protein n=1 Tax=Phytohabitans sp. LJ34 TaxID=3452217 RepID=UPI003F8B311B
MDPITISLAIAFFGALAVAIVAISVKRIFQWFRARGKIKEENANVIAFTLAERIKGKQYVEVPGVFDNKPTNTRIVQGFYDLNTETIVDARAMASSSPPEDEAIVTQHDQGEGLVIYR